MNCLERVGDITNCVREGQLNPELKRHLSSCGRCLARWEDEEELASHLRRTRQAAAGRRAPAEVRERLMEAFVYEHRRPQYARWAMAAAAVLAAGLFLAQAVRSLSTHQPIVSDDGEGLIAEDGFVTVPYALPLAEGESVRVMRVELPPAALSRLGIDVSTPYADVLTADLIVGEDDLPRAVRVLEESEL